MPKSKSPDRRRRRPTEPPATCLDGRYRTFSVRAAATLNPDQRTVEAILSTETPVLMPDWERWAMVPETLRMDGLKLERQQIPLLDTHDWESVRSILGSVTNIRKSDSQLIGLVSFSQVAADEFTKVREGHITDLSIGYHVLKNTHIPEGESGVVAGRSYEGPINVVTEWELAETSLVPIGANREAVLRGYQSPIFGPTEQEEREMPDPIPTPTPQSKPEPPVAVDEEAVRARAVESERIRAREIKAACRMARVPAEFSDELIDQGISLDQARAKIIEKLAQLQPPAGTSTIDSGPSQRDKTHAAVRGALLTRCWKAARIQAEVPKEDLGDGWQDFRRVSLIRLAEVCLRESGCDTRRLFSPVDVARLAIHSFQGRSIFQDGKAFSLRAEHEPYHVTAHFPNLVLDAQNKTLLQGYMEAASTWEPWARQAPSTSDFKKIHRVRLGEVPSPEVVPEGVSYPNVSLSDEKESYDVDKHGLVFGITMEALLNDDVDALSRIPAMIGASMRRKVNRSVYSRLTANENLQDGQALFSAVAGNRKKSNITSPGAAPSVAEIGKGVNLMRQQVGMNNRDGTVSEAILNITPRFLICPSALEVTAKQAVLSAFDPALASGIANNPWRFLTVVVEPLLDATSTVQWYLASTDVDTVEVTFLAGEETPVTESWSEPENDSVMSKARQTFGTAAIDFRALYRNAGA